MKLENKCNPCKICGSKTQYIGSKLGYITQKDFFLCQCNQCSFYQVANPILEYSQIYNLDYYSGKGADPTVDYIYEMEYPKKTIRNYEWNSILSLVDSFFPDKEPKLWLDYGSGMGGLVNYVSKNSHYNCIGFEEGETAIISKNNGLPILNTNELEQYYGKCDIVTSIEVLEHIADPIHTVSTISKLLKRGGYFFFTTGNSSKFYKNILNWSYYKPEIHISLFSPKSISQLFSQQGMEWMQFERKQKKLFSGIIQYKILKTLRVKNQSLLYELFPWFLFNGLVDTKYGITEMGYGVKK